MTHKSLWYFNIQTDHLILARKPDLIIINKKKIFCKIVDFAVPADHRINLKECEKKDKCRDLARKSKKLWNMKVTIVPIVIGAFGTIIEWFLKRLFKWQHCWERPESWEESWRLRETCCHSNSSEKPSANTDVKNSIGVNDYDNSICKIVYFAVQAEHRKNQKRRIFTSNCKNNETERRKLYQLWLVLWYCNYRISIGTGGIGR